MRADGRGFEDLRDIKIEIHVSKWSEGSAFISQGDTKVFITSSVLNSVPPFRKNNGWIYAEYSMLPRSVDSRTSRNPGGRGLEIQRMIGRCLRAVVDLNSLGERMIVVDCDVIQADGGTRCASINGGFVSLFLAIYKLFEDGLIQTFPIKRFVGAVSCGILSNNFLIDMNYEEDSKADADIVVSATNFGEIVEVQVFSERRVITKSELLKAIDLALSKIPHVIKIQEEVLKPYLKKLEQMGIKFEIN